MIRPQEPERPAPFHDVSQLGNPVAGGDHKELPLSMQGVDVVLLKTLNDVPDKERRMIEICKYIIRTFRDKLRVIVGDVASIPDLERELDTMKAEEIDEKYHLLYRNAQELYGKIFPQE